MAPEGWKKTTLKKIIRGAIKNGYSPNAPETETGYYVLGLSALNGNGLSYNNLKPAPNVKKVRDSILKPGDFVISRSNTRDKVGRAGLFKGEVQRCTYPDLMMRFNIDVDNNDLSYIENILNCYKTKKHFESCAAGTSGSMVKINKSIVENLPLCLPPLPEQKKIASILSTWDKAIETVDKLIENSKQQKKALMQQLLTGKKRLPGFCGEWKEVRLGDVVSLTNGRGFKSEEWSEHGLPIIRIQNLNGEQAFNYYSGEYDDNILVQEGDLLFAWSGSRGTSFGPYVWHGGQGLLNQHIWKVCITKNYCIYNYIRHYLDLLTEEIEDKAHGAGNLVHITKKEMINLVIQLPGKNEQQGISTVLSAIDYSTKRYQTVKSNYISQKQALMQQLLTGKRRVTRDSANQKAKGKVC